MKRVLISGANGFLGSYLASEALKLGYQVGCLKRLGSDLSRLDQIKNRVAFFDLSRNTTDEICRNFNPDIVIHTACNYGRSGNNIVDLMQTNVIFSLKLLESAKSFGVKAFLNTDSALEKDVSPYALSKHQFKEWGMDHSGQMKFINMRVEHMYGPKDDGSKFIYWFINQLRKKVTSIPLTSGTQLRDFIYITDVVSAFLVVISNLEKLDGHEEFDVATGNLVSVRAFLTELYEKYILLSGCGSTTELSFGEIKFRENEMMAPNVSPEKLKALGWSAKVDLTDGITMMLSEEFS